MADDSNETENDYVNVPGIIKISSSKLKRKSAAVAVPLAAPAPPVAASSAEAKNAAKAEVPAPAPAPAAPVEVMPPIVAPESAPKSSNPKSGLVRKVPLIELPPVEELPVELPPERDPRICAELFDPCTREPIEGGDIDILEKRVRDIKKQRLIDIAEKAKLPSDIVTRLDLLLFILNREELPNEGLLQYSQNGQLYESYWDIVFTLGLIDTFPVTNEFYMYNGKIEKLKNIDEAGFINNPLTYLSVRKVNEGSKSGASDITFVYKKHKVGTDMDPCSSDPTIQVSASCRKESSSKKETAEERPLFYFCSSKYFSKDATKGVHKFDIQNIYTAAKNLDQEYDRKIILLVKDKGTVDKKLRDAIRKYISEEVSRENVYGMTDLFAALTSLYTFVHSKHHTKDKLTSAHIREILKLELPPNPILRLRLHQYLATYKIHDAIKEFKKGGANNKFLVGIVPRGGKTFIAGGIIDALNPKRVVVLLGAKSETLSQFKKDLFEKFQNFQEYECIDVVNAEFKKAIDPSKKYIFIMSVELFKQVDPTRVLLQDLKSGANRADLFICDEAHLKQTTAKAIRHMEKGTASAVKIEEEEDVSEEAEESQLKELDKQIRTDVPVVYMTGTYMKPLTSFSIPDDHVVIWDYQDIQQAKELSTNEEYFKENFGEFYDRALATCISLGQTYETIEKQYQQFPELYLLTTQFTPDAKDAFLLQGKSGFPTISHLFEVKADFNPEATTPELWHTGFTNPKGITRLLNYLAPSVQQIKTANGDAIEPISSVLKSIDMIAQRIGDRLGFFTTDFVVHSQLWFLPHMQKNPLYKRMCALAGAIFQSPWFRKYFHVIAVSSSVKWNIPGSKDNTILVKASDGSDSCGTFSWYDSPCPTGDGDEKSLKQCLLDQEAVARKKGKGLIILAQNMLHLGISLPCVDIVVLLDTGEKVDERIQKMYRALTESTNKKGGYIIDMNYFRTVYAIMNYQIAAEKSRKGKKEVYAGDIPRLFNKVLDIYSIDDDKHILRTDIERGTLPELEKLIATGKKSGDGIMLEDAGHALNSNIRHVIEKDYSSLYDDFLGSLAEEKIRQKKMLREEGVNVNAAAHNKDEKGEEENEEEESEYTEPVIFKDGATDKQRRDAFIDIFKTTLKLGAFGTDAVDIKALEETLATDDKLRQTLYDTLIKRDAIKEDTVDPEGQMITIIDHLVRPGLIKMISEGRNASYFKMKESIEDEEKYPAHIEKVLDYIKEHLTPKSAERHKFGEVFTPMTLVNEMLDTLPAEVWTNRDLKWLDPANGMGNFPIGVFLRLFYGFRTKAGKYIGITKDGEGDYNPGLTKVIPSEEARRKHIVKDMLYMIELNSKNNAIAKNLFKKLAPGVEPNIEQIHRKNGFLAAVDMKFSNGTVKAFDIIMGNPPYNSGSTRAMATRKTRNAREELGVAGAKHINLWIPFTDKSLELLKKDGLLLFVMPIGWFKPDKSGIYEKMLSHQIHKMRIIFNTDAKKIFGGSGEINIAYFLLEKAPPTTPTHIIDIYNNSETVKLKPTSILGLAYNSIFIKIQNKSSLLKDSDDYHTTAISNAKCESGPHKQLHRITDKGDITFVKTKIAHPAQNTPKLFLSGAKYPRFYYDKVGEYGIIGTDQNYFTGDKLERLVDYFKTKLSALLMANIKYRMKFIAPDYYPDVRTIPLDKITDDTLADFFGFTKEERKIINDIEYPERKYEFKQITCAQLKGENTGDSTADAPCPPDKERLPGTRNCIKKCIPPKIRNEKGRCVNPPGAKSRRSVKRGGGHKTRRASR